MNFLNNVFNLNKMCKLNILFQHTSRNSLKHVSTQKPNRYPKRARFIRQPIRIRLVNLNISASFYPLYMHFFFPTSATICAQLSNAQFILNNSPHDISIFVRVPRA